MALSFSRIAIVGATGPTGRALAAELAEREAPVRVISRRGEALEAMFPAPDVEKRAADALDKAEIAAAVDGCDLIVDCIGLPGDRMAEHAATAENLAQATTASGARLMQVSSYWCYMPIRKSPLSEDHPRTGGPDWAVLRRAAEDILREAGAAILHLPDFFGPHVHTSTLQNPIRDAVAGKAMNWVGAAHVERDYIFVPDAMRIAADLAVREEAYGEDWVIPGCGPISANTVARHLSEILGRPVRVRAAGPLLLRLLGVFNAELRDFMQVVPDYVKPLSFDGRKLKALLGPTPRTPWRHALSDTVAAMRAEKRQSV